MKYIVILDPGVTKDIRRLDSAVQPRIKRAIAALADNPRPSGCRKMVGYVRRWRIRVGDYRVVYDVEDEIITVHVAEVAHRKDIYR